MLSRVDGLDGRITNCLAPLPHQVFVQRSEKLTGPDPEQEEKIHGNKEPRPDAENRGPGHGQKKECAV